MVKLQEFKIKEIQPIFSQYGMQLNALRDKAEIPFSFWGAPEAGRQKNQLYIRNDTPMHSLLHESCHYVCMPQTGRISDSPDAAGSTAEENATCYLQILISDHIARFSRTQQMQDMDNWGYSFRLGSASAWFHQDAEDAKKWLAFHEIIDAHDQISWKLRK